MQKALIMDFLEAIRNEGRQKMLDNLEGAKKDVIEAYKKGLKEGKAGEDTLSGYGRSQRYRRSKKGLQTARKDLQYSGTLLGSLKEVSRTQGDDFVEIELGFTGSAYRREDQSSLDNEALADHLSDQQLRGKPILKLSRQDTTRIEGKWGVKIGKT